MPSSPDSGSAAQSAPANSNDTGIGGRPVPVFGIILTLIYLIGLSAILLYVLVALWPTPTPSGKPAPTDSSEQVKPSSTATATVTPTATTTSASNITLAATASPTAKLSPSPRTDDNDCHQVRIFGYEWEIADEVRLLMLVICAGALGSLVHGIRSIYWYIGNRNFILSWVPKYVLLPVSGAILSVIFYFVLRGGLFSPRAGFEQTSPFGFAALGALIGMFSEQAVLKLKEIAETLLSKPAEGKNAEPEK